MLFKSVAFAALMAGSAMAQSSTAASSTSSSSAAAPTIDPESVDPQTKASWCIGQRNVCDTLCSKDAPTNMCNANDLTFTCQCSNDKTPAGIDTYKTSLPAFICNEAYGQCIKAHPDDALGQNGCKDDILSQCGDKDITKFVGSPSSGNDDDDDNDNDNDDDDDADATTTSTATSGEATTTATTTSDGSATDAADSSATTSDAPAKTTDAPGSATKNGASLALAAGVMAAFVYML